MAVRYGFDLEGRPITCPCGKSNITEHSLTCALGGYVQLRHNELRYLTVNLLKGQDMEIYLLSLTYCPSQE